MEPFRHFVIVGPPINFSNVIPGGCCTRNDKCPARIQRSSLFLPSFKVKFPILGPESKPKAMANQIVLFRLCPIFLLSNTVLSLPLWYQCILVLLFSLTLVPRVPLFLQVSYILLPFLYSQWPGKRMLSVSHQFQNGMPRLLLLVRFALLWALVEFVNSWRWTRKFD